MSTEFMIGCELDPNHTTDFWVEDGRIEIHQPTLPHCSIGMLQAKKLRDWLTFIIDEEALLP